MQSRTIMMGDKIEFMVNNGFEKIKPQIEYKVYRRRWFILVLFILYSISNYLQYITFSVIANIITEYYQVSYGVVDWTTFVATLTYIILSIPGTYVIDKIGLRKCVIIGIIGTSVGAWINVASVHPDRFWFIIVGQGIASIFRITIYPVVPKLAATWFAYNQTSTACGISVIGMQAGMALSFMLPPFIVRNGKVEDIERGLYTLNIGYAVFSTLMVPLLIIFFADAPPTPPSIAQQQIVNKKNCNQTKSFLATCKTIVFIKPYMLYLIIYGVNMGMLTSIQILSNQIILNYYPSAEYDVGIIGLLVTALSVIGSMCTAILLDKYKKFKITCWAIHFVFFMLLIFYIGTIDQGLKFVYISSVLVGIWAGGLSSVAFELTVEFTYPEAATVCMGLVLNWMMLVSLVFTILGGYVLRSFGFIWASMTMVAIIFACNLLFFILKFELRRKDIQDSQSKTKVSQSQ